MTMKLKDHKENTEEGRARNCVMLHDRSTSKFILFFFICVSTNFEFSQPLSSEIREVNSTQINPIKKEEEEKLGKVSQTGSRITLNKFSSGWIDSGNFVKLVWNLALPPVAMHHHALSFKQKKGRDQFPSKYPLGGGFAGGYCAFK